MRVGTQFFREVEVGKGDTKQVVLVPVDVEVNVDPLELLKAAGVAGAVAVAGGLVAYVAWNGLVLPAPAGPFELIPGLKKTSFWAGQAQKLAARIQDRQVPGPDLTEASKATKVSDIDCAAARVLYSGLSDFSRGFCRRNGLTSSECLAAWRELQERCGL